MSKLSALFVCTALTITLVGGCASPKLLEARKARDEARERYIKIIPDFQKKLNQGLPKLLDEDISLTSIGLTLGKWSTNYKFVKHSAYQFDIDEFKRAQRLALIETLCRPHDDDFSNKMTRMIRLTNGVMENNWHGMDGELIASIQVSRDDCK